jgi:hypothetical protein
MGPRLLALNETGSLEHIRPVVSDEAETTTPESSTNEDVTGTKEK